MRIERGSDPGPFSESRKYVGHLRKIFRCRCAYCLTPDEFLGGEEAMKVDHFRPESRFPKLRLVWSNLYYVCDTCNNRKSDHPREDEESQGFRFVDPCAEDPDDHFCLSRDPETGDFCRVTHCSEPAKYTIRRLQWNRSKFLRDHWREIDANERRFSHQIQNVRNLQAEFVIPDEKVAELLSDLQVQLNALRAIRPFPLEENPRRWA